MKPFLAYRPYKVHGSVDHDLRSRQQVSLLDSRYPTENSKKKKRVICLFKKAKKSNKGEMFSPVFLAFHFSIPISLEMCPREVFIMLSFEELQQNISLIAVF